jgi:hypothetical protein
MPDVVEPVHACAGSICRTFGCSAASEQVRKREWALDVVRKNIEAIRNVLGLSNDDNA